MERVLIIIGNMGLGGAETHIMKVYRKINKNAFQFDFILNVPQECYYEKEIELLGGKCYRVTPKSKSILKNYKDIKRIVKDNGYNIVFKCGEHAFSWTEMKAAKSAGAKGRIMRSTNSSLSGSLKSLLLHYLSRPLLNYYITDRIAPSIEAALWLFGPKYLKHTKIVNNAIDLDAYEYNDVKRKTIRSKYNIPENGIVIGHVGRFSVQKNHNFLIALLSHLVAKDDKFYLLCVGEGDLLSSVKDEIVKYKLTHHVILCGNQSDMQGYYSAMDVFVLPSLYEGMPNVVIEAQGNGLRCIISDTVTKDSDITGENFYLPLNDIEIWEQTVKNIEIKRIDPKDSFVAKKYDIDSVTMIYENIFSNVGALQQ